MLGSGFLGLARPGVLELASAGVLAGDPGVAAMSGVLGVEAGVRTEADRGPCPQLLAAETATHTSDMTLIYVFSMRYAVSKRN